MTGNTFANIDRYAVVGNPIAHSKSPLIHQAFAQQTQQHLDYQKILCPLGEFPSCANDFFDNGGKGLNITVPFKEDAYRFAHQLTPRATLAGAVNTLILKDNGQIQGDNTDGAGLISHIQSLGWPLRQKKILILGAGGAVRGVLEPLLASQPERVVIANRTLSKAEELASAFFPLGNIYANSYDELDTAFDLVINATSASLQGDLPPLKTHLFAKNAHAYDMVYGNTPFLTWAKTIGVPHTSDGLGMLIGQAAEAFYLWRGIRPDTSSIATLLQQT